MARTIPRFVCASTDAARETVLNELQAAECEDKSNIESDQCAAPAE